MFSRGRLLFTPRNCSAVTRSLHQHHSRTAQKLRYVTVIGGCAASLLAIDYLKRRQNVHFALSNAATPRPEHHLKARPDLPTFDESALHEHNNPKSGIWVSYGIGVYDITKFIPEHPGNDKIMLAAGNAIDPFWNIYQQHNNAEVLELLETYRIGNLKEEEGGGGVKDMFDPWSAEPKRSPVLRPASQRPFNAEPPPEILADSFITPNEFFYVRNHLPVPDIDAASYELEVETAAGAKTVVLTLDKLKKYPKHTVTAAIMCGGNRRSEMNKVKQVRGLDWGMAAVGNAEWTGVRLSDVLREMGVQSDETSHVQFEGLDTDPTSTPYGASIPLAKAMDPRGDVILAYEMNGKPLSRDHGYPVRVIVPGVVGARNVKWLGRIIVSKKESDSHWQQNDYKAFSPSTDWDTVDFSKAPAIQHMPVTSAICTPKANERVPVDDDKVVEVKGYAFSGGGNRIIRVDVTADGGKTWQVAELEQEDVTKAPSGRHWGWTLWTARVPVAQGARNVEIWTKAVDSNYNTQPETVGNIWNLRGVLSNAYHKVKVDLYVDRKGKSSR